MRALKLSVKALWAATILSIYVVPAFAQDMGESGIAELKPLNAAIASGTYAGSFLCSLGEMGMTLTLQDVGPAQFAEDIGQLHCKSGAGLCNDRQNAKIKTSRTATGVINFFPVVSNPDAPTGAFKVSGHINYGMKSHWRIKLQPGEWIAKPEGFGSSALEGMIHDGQISGKPTASGCHTLELTKIRTQ